MYINNYLKLIVGLPPVFGLLLLLSEREAADEETDDVGVSSIETFDRARAISFGSRL